MKTLTVLLQILKKIPIGAVPGKLENDYEKTCGSTFVIIVGLFLEDFLEEFPEELSREIKEIQEGFVILIV